MDLMNIKWIHSTYNNILNIYTLNNNINNK